MQRVFLKFHSLEAETPDLLPSRCLGTFVEFFLLFVDSKYCESIQSQSPPEGGKLFASFILEPGAGAAGNENEG